MAPQTGQLVSVVTPLRAHFGQRLAATATSAMGAQSHPGELWEARRPHFLHFDAVISASFPLQVAQDALEASQYALHFRQYFAAR
jgi:hypothetical protein